MEVFFAADDLVASDNELSEQTFRRRLRLVELLHRVGCDIVRPRTGCSGSTLTSFTRMHTFLFPTSVPCSLWACSPSGCHLSFTTTAGGNGAD